MADNKAFAKAVAPRKTFIYALQKSIKHLSLLVAFRQTMFQIKPIAKRENVSGNALTHMKMKKLHIFILLLSFIYSCQDKDQNIELTSKKNTSIHITNDFFGRGASYNDSQGRQCYYRTLRAHITNDTTIPIKLLLHLPNNDIDLSPKSNKHFKVFLLPETYTSENKNSITPTTISFNNELEKPKDLNKIIRPGESYTVDLEFFFNSNSTTGTTRGQMILSDPKVKLFDSDTIIKLSNKTNTYLNILLNVSLESNITGTGIYSSTIFCGQLTF